MGSYPGLSEGPSIITRVPQPTQPQCPLLASLVAQAVKNPPAMQETRGLSLVGKIPWRRKWQPTPVFLPGESHGQRSLVGYILWGHKESDTTERLTHTIKSLTEGHLSFTVILSDWNETLDSKFLLGICIESTFPLWLFTFLY